MRLAVAEGGISPAFVSHLTAAWRLDLRDNPNGVTVNSQGCKPLEKWREPRISPNGTTEPRTTRQRDSRSYRHAPIARFAQSSPGVLH